MRRAGCRIGREHWRTQTLTLYLKPFLNQKGHFDLWHGLWVYERTLNTVRFSIGSKKEWFEEICERSVDISWVLTTTPHPSISLASRPMGFDTQVTYRISVKSVVVRCWGYFWISSFILAGRFPSPLPRASPRASRTLSTALWLGREGARSALRNQHVHICCSCCHFRFLSQYVEEVLALWCVAMASPILTILFK